MIVLAAFAFLRGPISSPIQAGEISSETAQSGSSDSGDAVGGQVVGVASSGDASIDATNRSEDVDVSTGDSSGSNTHDGTVTSSGFSPGDLRNQLEQVGLQFASDEEILEFFEEFSPEDVETVAAILAGEFLGSPVESSTTQSGDVGSGDAILGQTVGVVTTRRGQADLVLSNESLDSSAESGDTDLTNDSTSVVESFVSSPK